MKKLILFASVALLALLSGCTTYYRDSIADHLTYSTGVANARYVTEFEIDKTRVKAEGTAAVLFGIFHIAEDKRCLSMQDPNFSIFEFLGKILSPTYITIQNAKNVALFNACETYGADQLMGTTFDYVVKNYLFFARVECTVKGFPAKAKAVKVIDKKPIILNKWQKIEYIAPYDNPIKYSDKAPAGNFSLSEFMKK
jgi:hypothetical protein